MGDAWPTQRRCVKRDMNIAVIGVGAMGCLFGAYLARVARIVMVGRWPEQVAALQKEGLTLVGVDGSDSHNRLHASSDPADAYPADVALILVKSSQTEGAARQARRALTAAGVALTLQNGLGNVERLATVLGSERAALGVTSQGATVLAPGRVQHAGHGSTHLARTPATAETLAHLAALLNQAGLESYLTDNADGLVWAKLAVNAGINPLTALLGVRNGYLAQSEQARGVMSRAAEEAAAVARAQGIDLPFTDAAGRALAVARATAANYSSMLQDVRRGVPTEIDSICGAIVEYGRRYKVATPVNERLYQLVKRLEGGELAIGELEIGDWPMCHRGVEISSA